MRNSYRAKTTKYSIRLEDAKLEQLKKIYGEMGTTELIKSLIDERLEGKFNDNIKVKSPIIRMGGKSKLADDIVSMFPKHKIYVDLFGGAGHVLLRKSESTSRIEVFNDKYDEIYNMFKVIKSRPLDLQSKLLEMSHSKSFYDKLKKSRANYTDSVDKASIFIYLCRYSFLGDLNAGYRTSRNNSIAKQIERIANDMKFISHRLRNVILENRDYKTIIKKYDDEDTLFFIDPPYLIENKKEGIYEHKFNRKDMHELIKILKNIKGKFIFTHYENNFLNQEFSGWTNKRSIITAKASGKIIQGKKPKVIENIYYNFDLEV